MTSLYRQFQRLRRLERSESGKAVFTGLPISGCPHAHLAKDVDERPAILFQITCTSPGSWPPPIRLENLAVSFDVKCRLVCAGAKTIDDRFVLFHCLSCDTDLQEYFLRVITAVLSALSINPSVQEIHDAADRLVELFRALRKISSRSVQGLWGELFLMVESSEPLTLLRAWHENPPETFDFSLLDESIEVKCSASRHRRHYFSLDQVYPPEGRSLLIASLFVEQSSGGKTLGELWDRIREIAIKDPELLLKVEKICIETLGQSWHEATRKRYDAELARESLRFYRVEEIPRVQRDHPLGVYEIRFQSDLELASPIQLKGSLAEGSLLNACRNLI